MVSPVADYTLGRRELWAVLSSSVVGACAKSVVDGYFVRDYENPPPASSIITSVGLHCTSTPCRVEFQFRHNVCGRRMYAEGTADAAEFVANKAASEAEKRVYNMVDVLKEGGM